MEQGLRFVHLLGMQTKYDLAETTARLTALVDTLVAQGAVDPAQLQARVGPLKQAEVDRLPERAHVTLSHVEDKYALEDTPQIDCAALLPLCRARCCKLHFPLSTQDLDERVVQWNYGRPYLIRQRASDGYCVHCDADSGGCGVYAQRPAVCRVFDCRNDPRIWLDFHKRIPAPMSALQPGEASEEDGGSG